MPRLLFRSIRRKKRVISISVDDEVLDFLDKQQNTSAFISDLVRKAMAEEEKPPEELETAKPAQSRVLLTKEMGELLQKRNLFNAYYGEKFEKLEEFWLDFRKGDEEEWKKAVAQFKPDVEEYFKNVNNIHAADYTPGKPNYLLNEYISVVYEEREKRQQLRLINKCGGNPDEEVWHGLTRADIMMHFQRGETHHYSVIDVASKLGISYDQAYKRVVPWLKAQDVNVS